MSTTAASSIAREDDLRERIQAGLNFLDEIRTSIEGVDGSPEEPSSEHMREILLLVKSAIVEMTCETVEEDEAEEELGETPI